MPCPCGNSVDCCHAGVNTAAVAADAAHIQEIDDVHKKNKTHATILRVPSNGECSFCTAKRQDTEMSIIQKMTGLGVVRTTEWGIRACVRCVRSFPVIPNNNQMTLEDLTNNAVPVVCSYDLETLFYAFKRQQ
jgi:hypothetical protein